MHLGGKTYHIQKMGALYMKKWIMKKLGIVNHAKESARIGQAIGEGIRIGVGKQRTIDDPVMMARIKSISKATDIDKEELIKQVATLNEVMGMDHSESLDALLHGIDIPGMTTEQAINGALENTTWSLDKTDMSTTSRDKVDHTNWGKSISASRDNHTIIDPMIQDIEKTVWDQQEKVLRSGKYEHPIHKDNHSALEWIDHQGQEFADAMVYRECLKQTISDVIEHINQAKSKTKNIEVHRELVHALERMERGGQS